MTDSHSKAAENAALIARHQPPPESTIAEVMHDLVDMTQCATMTSIADGLAKLGHHAAATVALTLAQEKLAALGAMAAERRKQAR